MVALEITLLVIAYTLIIITIFLEIICYRKNLELLETIGFTVSLLLLIIALTISPFLIPTDAERTTNIFVLLAMVLVGCATPLDSLEEREHGLHPLWKKSLIGLSIGLFLLVIIGHFIGILNLLQYVVAIFLGISVMLSMLLIQVTKPKKRIVHREKIDRIFSIVVMIVVPLYLVVNFSIAYEYATQFLGFTIPLVFIFLAASKLLDNLQRLSFFNTTPASKEQHFKNYSLTEREREVAIILAKGTPYKQISEELHISMPTVKTHASNIYRKCGVKNRTELSMLLVS